MRIAEIFYSVQGEGSLIGVPSIFVRTSGCNLRCSWCDSQYTFPRGKPYSIDELVQSVHTPYVCITGGEPLLQEGVYSLMARLADAGCIVSCETNGSISTRNIDPRVRIILDIKCPGSGQAEKNEMGNLAMLRPHDEVKFVIADENDYAFAKKIMSEHHLTNVLFSSAWGVLEPQILADWIVRDRIPVRFNMQLHKILWGLKAGV